MQIKVNTSGIEDKYKLLVQNSVICLDRVIYDPIFLECLKEQIAKSNNLEGENSDWKTALPVQIYAQLFPIELLLHTYYTFKNVIGFGYPDSKDIWINTKYLSQYNSNELLHLMKVGSNILHEHSHDCGFDHDFSATDDRTNSISYVLNRAYEQAFRIIYALPAPTIVNVYTPWYRRAWRKVKGWF